MSVKKRKAKRSSAKKPALLRKKVAGKNSSKPANNVHVLTHRSVVKKAPGKDFPSVDFRLLFESAPALYLVLDPQLTILAVSDGYLKATMTTREGILGRYLFDVFPDNPDDPKADGTSNLRTSLDRVIQKRVPDTMAIQKYDIRDEKGNFEERFWSPLNSPVLGATGELLYIIHRVEDVTQKIKAGQKGMEDFRNAIAFVKDYALITLDRNGKILSWNVGAELIKGYKADEIIGKNFSVFYPPEAVQAGHPQEFLRQAAQQGRAEEEGRRVRKDGSTFIADVVITALKDDLGEITGFIKVTRDITEKKKDEDKFRSLLEAAPDAMVMVDEKGKIILVNARTIDLFGYQREELMGQPIEMLIPQRFRRDHPAHRGEYTRSPKTRPMGAGLDLHALRKDGTEFPAEISLSPIRTAEGTLVTAAIRDTTERRRMLEEQNRRMQEANRLKSEFLANMSHELRTPLNAIIGFSELMYNEKVGPVSADHKEYLGDILTSSRHLLQLINDVLDLTKVEAGKMEFRPEDLNLLKVITEVKEILRGLSGAKNIQIEVEIDPALPTVHLDHSKFKQVLYNYLSNAIKFTPEKGLITVRLTQDTPGMFRLAVEDSGIGIRAEDIPKLFVEFQQLDAGANKKYAGTGLGLALTRRIVEAQGGRVEVRSEFGKGSVFSAVFPLRWEEEIHGR